MTFEEYGITKRTINALAKKKIFSPKDLIYTFPRKYHDYRHFYRLNQYEIPEDNVAIHFQMTEIRTVTTSKIPLTACRGIDLESGQTINIKWFHQNFLAAKYRYLLQEQVVACGKITYDPTYGFQMNSPEVFIAEHRFEKEIVPVYKKCKGVSNEKYSELLDAILDDTEEILEKPVLNRAKLKSFRTALMMIHHPETLEEIAEGKKRLMFNDALYFSLSIEKEKEKARVDSPYVIKNLDSYKKLRNNLPYSLTEDQAKCVELFLKNAKQATRNNMLVQGDVGCGKSIVAFLEMFSMADNGYQSVIMAPTGVLAGQHYNELTEYANKFGYKTAYLGSEVKGKEKKAILKAIKKGEIQFIVGTHSVISEGVEYHNLGLIITDEEHRFGVKQKKALEEKALLGAHIVSLSATPIPRSLAGTVIGSDKTIMSITSMPNGRKPVKTQIASSQSSIFSFIEKQIAVGRQAYVVCPLIEEAEEDSKMAGIESVEETFKAYDKYFGRRGIEVGVLNGKMNKEEISDTIQDFAAGNTKILISTTVIEVGVNVPNANVIVINNAERFGLASLHQLRGRVGRGSYQSYCILKSSDSENERLKTMEQTTSGFDIAEKDLQMRGTGDILGVEQSGSNRYTDIIITRPKFYGSVCKYAKWMIENHMGDKLLDYYQEEKELG